MTWNPNEEPVDYVVIAGQRTPGLAEIIGASSPRQWDEGRGPGLSGARLRFRGRRLSHFIVRIRLYTTQDFADWEAFRPVLLPPRPDVAAFNNSVRAAAEAGRLGGVAPLSDANSRALDIVHPILDGVGITSVVVEDVGAPSQTDDGEWTIEVKLIEHRPPEPAALVIDGSSSSQDSRDENDVRIERLTGELADAVAAEGVATMRSGG